MTDDNDLGGPDAGFRAVVRVHERQSVTLRYGLRLSILANLYAKGELGSHPLTRNGRCNRTRRFCAPEPR